MGLTLSAISKLGLPGVNWLATDQVYDKYVKDKDIKDLEGFHITVIDLCKDFNSIMPGKHYDTPSSKDIKEFFEKWKKESEQEKKRMFIEFVKKNVKESKTDDKAIVIAGLVVPSAAIVIKKTGENMSPVKKFRLHLIPNFIFVPACTLAALIGSRAMKINEKSMST